MNPKQKEQITLAANVEFGRKGAAEMLLLKKVHSVEDSVDSLKGEVANKVDKAHFEATIAQVQTIKGEKGDSVVGPAGQDGVDGKDGVAGKDGKHGNNGVDGKDGAAGQDGHTHTPEELKAIILPLIPKPEPVVVPEVDVEAIANQVEQRVNARPSRRVGGVHTPGDNHVTASLSRIIQTETPIGTINGINKIFTVKANINAILSFILNSQAIHPVEYSFANSTITFVTAPDASLAGLSFTVVYA